MINVMSNIFANLSLLIPRWVDVKSRKLSWQERRIIAYVVVKESSFGFSLEFHLKAKCIIRFLGKGGLYYIPIHRDSRTVEEAELIHKDDIRIVTMSNGHDEVLRALIK